MLNIKTKNGFAREKAMLPSQTCLMDKVKRGDPSGMPKRINEMYTIMYMTFTINRFTKGLSCLGLFGELQRHEELMKTLFVRTHYNPDAVGFELAFGTPSFSEEGSNHWHNELRTQLHWRDLLQDLEGWHYFCIIDA